MMTISMLFEFLKNRNNICMQQFNIYLLIDKVTIHRTTVKFGEMDPWRSNSILLILSVFKSDLQANTRSREQNG